MSDELQHSQERPVLRVCAQLVRLIAWVLLSFGSVSQAAHPNIPEEPELRAEVSFDYFRKLFGFGETRVLKEGAPAVTTVQTVIDDMGLPNDAPLLGISDHAWATNKVPAQVAMGSNPRGCSGPQWWLNSHAKKEYKDCDLWTGYIQWFIVFEGGGNAATNARIEIRNPRSYFLSKSSGRWYLVTPNQSSHWFPANKTVVRKVLGELDVDDLGSGVISLRVETGKPYTYHGIGDAGLIDITGDAADIEAVFATVEARLTVDDETKPNDLDKAVWLVQSGADYYPSVRAKVEEALPPGVGLSRSKRVTSQWQSFNMATLDNARQDYTGASRSIAVKQFEQNPPPPVKN